MRPMMTSLVASPVAPRLSGLPPIIAGSTRLLILGSFPSVSSLARQQYYAHPSNRFWPILQAIWPSIPMNTGVGSYEKRSDWLLERGLGLWDVYASCVRAGSLDAAIRQPVMNDFARLRSLCPQLRVIGYNGGESFRHARLVAASWSPAESQRQSATPLPLHRRLPSTSPANASWRFERKLNAWRELVALAGLL